MGKLLRISPNIQQKFPEILTTKKLDFLVYSTQDYILIAFLSESERRKIDKLIKNNVHPFPALIAPKEYEGAVAFNIQNSKNNIFANNKISNLYSFKLGSDSTFIVYNHSQSNIITDLGQYEYIISLAFIISFGDVININNFYNYLDELVDFFILKWGSRNE